MFATLHTNDAATALDRIVDVFPADRQAQIRVQLAAALCGVVSQRLIPRIGGGMVAAFEVIVATNPVRNLIRDGKTHQLRNIVATNMRDGMQTMEAALNGLVQAGRDQLRGRGRPQPLPPRDQGPDLRRHRGLTGRAQPPLSVELPLKMPYIAETSATATKPTITPITMITAGSASAVSRASL